MALPPIENFKTKQSVKAFKKSSGKYSENTPFIIFRKMLPPNYNN